MTTTSTSVPRPRMSVKGQPKERFVALSLEHVRNQHLKPTEFRVLAYIASYDWAGKGCWVEQETFAPECCISVKTLYLTIQSLQKKGLITKKRTQHGNTYYIVGARSSTKQDDITMIPSSADQPPSVDMTDPTGNFEAPNAPLSPELPMGPVKVTDTYNNEQVDERIDIQGEKPTPDRDRTLRGSAAPTRDMAPQVTVALRCIELNKEVDNANKGKYIKQATPLVAALHDTDTIDKLLRWEASKPQFRRGRAQLTPKIAYEDLGKWRSLGEPTTYDGRPTVTIVLSPSNSVPIPRPPAPLPAGYVNNPLEVPF